MLKFENITSEADFVTAYRHELSRLVEEIRRYVCRHGYDHQKYDLMFAEPLADLYMGLSNAANIRGFAIETMTALAMLWHKEVSEMQKALGIHVDNLDFILAEYEKVKHLLDRYSSASDAAPGEPAPDTPAAAARQRRK